jgi:hypothetical protein
MLFTNTNIIYLVTWFILPVIPAFILFRFLPSKAIASGPFHGLRVDLGGAFGGYFLLFITLIPLMFRLIKAKENIGEIWTVTGMVVDTTNNKIRQSSNPELALYPSTEVRNGEFRVELVATRQDNGEMQFPRITIKADKYVSANLEPLDYLLDQKESVNKDCWKMDCLHRMATLKKGVKLIPDIDISPDSITSKSTLYVQPQ